MEKGWLAPTAADGSTGHQAMAIVFVRLEPMDPAQTKWQAASAAHHLLLGI
jgi:hypothetical protein